MLAAALVLVASAASSLSSPARAQAECSLLTLCVTTDAGGTANLNVPPLSFIATYKPEVIPYEDCVWEVVNVNFGDGSPEAVYFWDGSKGLTGSHTFPSPGEYPVTINATQGHHSESEAEPPETCPDLLIPAKAVFPSPTPPPTETPAKPPKEEGKKPGEGGHKPTGGGGNSNGQGEEGGGESGGGHSIVFWRGCSHNVYAHRVACKKARTVIDGAQEKLSGRNSAMVAGFRCHLTDDLRPISCRRGKSRVLGPLG